MRTTELALPVVGLIAVTRGLLGAGVALLAAGRISPQNRLKVGRILVAIGVASTVPLLVTAIKRAR